jgi:DNA-binding transcriptional MocR family regulator
MTPADEAHFITLWQQGASYRELAAALGCPLGTVASRSAALVAQGKIQPRPRGGAYASRRAKARPESSPATPAPPTPPATPAAPAVTFVAVPEMQELLSLVKDLHARVGVSEQTRVPPALPAAPSTPAPPAAERQDIQQWTVRLSKVLIEHLKAVAYERRIPPSQLVEEWLWQQAHNHR